MFNFHDKIILAVGGAGYLCSPVCDAFAKQGASVVLTDLDQRKAEVFAERLQTEYSRAMLGISCDVAKEDSIHKAISDCIEEFGRIDVLVNAALKGSHSSTLEDMPYNAFSEAANVQLSGTFLLAREAAKVMPRGSSMVFFSSMYGSVSPDPSIYHAPMIPNPIDYGVVKAGLEQMIRYLAVHYAPQNIRVNGVAPGAFPNSKSLAIDPTEFQEFEDRLAAKSPLKRIGKQNELAGPVVFLASEEASFVTGQTLPVDGGWTIW